MDAKHQRWRELFVRGLKGDESVWAELDPEVNEHDGEYCVQCGDIFCPWGCDLHLHHDGCPACAQVPDELWDEFCAKLRVPMLLKRNGAEP